MRVLYLCSPSSFQFLAAILQPLSSQFSHLLSLFQHIDSEQEAGVICNSSDDTTVDIRLNESLLQIQEPNFVTGRSLRQ